MKRDAGWSSGGAPLTLRDLLAVLFRQGRLLVALFGIVFLLVLAASFSQPRYRGEMKFLVQRARLDPVVTPANNSQPLVLRMEVTDEELNSEVELLQNADLLQRVAAETGLVAKSSWWPGSTAERRLDEAAVQLRKRLTIEPVRHTNLIWVAYRSRDRREAGVVLATLAQLYLEKHRQVHRASGESAFFTQQANQYGATLESAERDLLDFVRRTGDVSAAMQRDLAVQRLADLGLARQQNLVTVVETEQRIRSLREKIAGTPERVTTAVREGDNPFLEQQLKTTLLNLELRKTELLTKYQPSYRLVQEADEEIDQARSMLAATERRPVREHTTDRDPRHTWAEQELVKAEVELSTLQARAGSTKALVERYQRLAEQLGESAVRQEDLQRTARLAEENFIVYRRRQAEAQVGDALDQRGILNVALAQAPVVPTLPIHEGWVLVLAAALAGSVVSLGSVLIADTMDPAFRTPLEAAELLAVPVLASFPRSSMVIELSQLANDHESYFVEKDQGN